MRTKKKIDYIDLAINGGIAFCVAFLLAYYKKHGGIW